MLVLGIAGKKTSGKSTLAWALAPWLNAKIAPFASAIKGGQSYVLGVLAFKPQMDDEVRESLRNAGMAGRNLREDLWIEVWKANFGNLEAAIVPDVRFENEVEFIHSLGGKVIYLSLPNAEDDPHPSEQLNPALCDHIITVDPDNRGNTIHEALNYLAQYYPLVKPKPLIYVGANIYGVGSQKVKDTFTMLREILAEGGFIPYIPVDAAPEAAPEATPEWFYALCYAAKHLDTKTFYQLFKEWVTEESGLPMTPREVALLALTGLVDWIVSVDLRLVGEAHACLFYLKQPSIGCAMEMLAAALQEKPIVCMVDEERLTNHPWLLSLATVITQRNPAKTEQEALRKIVEYLRAFFGL